MYSKLHKRPVISIHLIQKSQLVFNRNVVRKFYFKILKELIFLHFGYTEVFANGLKMSTNVGNLISSRNSKKASHFLYVRI